MRPIKFRGKSKQGTWFYGDLVRNFCFEPQGDIIACAIISDNDYVQVIPETVGQSIGFHDKNGREIWEDTFVIIPPKEEGECEVKGRVIFVHGCFMIDSEYGLYPLHIHEENDFEVIGNRFENAELLEQDNE